MFVEWLSGHTCMVLAFNSYTVNVALAIGRSAYFLLYHSTHLCQAVGTGLL